MKLKHYLLFCLVLVVFSSSVLSALTATGGNETTLGNYKIHTFNSDSNLIVAGSGNIQILLVGGGGAGERGGGGGGGGVIYNTSYYITTGTYTVNIGEGGIITGSNGNNSQFGTLTAYGGGGGGDQPNNGHNGGCGGGGGFSTIGTTTGGTGISGQGYAGGGNNGYIGSPYPSGGGGGAGAIGTNAITVTQAGNGGNGIQNNITGTLTYYGGGGGGGTWGCGTGGTGGLGGGGNGNCDTGKAQNGTNGLGGGGGGNGNGGTFGKGGNGIIIIKYVSLPRFTLTAKKFWDNASLNNFSVNVKGVGYDQSFSTTNGTVNTNLYSNATQLYNITYSSFGFFNQSYNNVNVSSAHVGTLKQSIINITVRNLFTNQTESGIVVRFNGSIKANTTGFSTVQYPNAGWYNIQVSQRSTGNDFHTTNNIVKINATNNKTITIYVHDHDLNVSVRKLTSNSSVSSFTINIRSLNRSDNRTLNTTGGLVSFPVTHDTYNVTLIKAQGYALYSPDGLTTNSLLVSISNNRLIYLYVYAYNSVNFSFFSTLTPTTLLSGIDINFTISNSGNTSFFNYGTNNGYRFVENLSTNNYNIIYDANNYNSNSYFFSVFESSTQRINLFLVPFNDTTLYKIIVKDQNDNNVVGVIVRLQQKNLINGQDVTIGECITNGDGVCFLNIIESTTNQYRFIVIQNDVFIKTTEYATIISLPTENKVITLRVDIGENLVEPLQKNLNLLGNVYLIGNVSYFSFVDGFNAISGGCLLVYRRFVPDPFSIIGQSCLYGFTSGVVSFNFSSFVSNNTEFRFDGYVNYTGSSVLLDSKNKYFSGGLGGGNNGSDNDGLFLTILLCLISSFIVIYIPNIFIQIIISGGILIGLSILGVNMFSIAICTGFIALGIFINWKRKQNRGYNYG